MVPARHFRNTIAAGDVRPEDRPRLLDAIYAAALRDRVPTAVVGETMMLLSRALDLEQKVQPGNSLTLIYSPIARDLKTGLGRIVFVSIVRTTGNLDCYVMQSTTAAFECVSAEGQNSVVAGGMVVPVNGIVVAKFGPQGSSADVTAEPMNFGVDWTAPLGSPVVAAFAGDVTAIGPEAPFGTVIRMSHLDNKTTMYAYLQRAETGIAVGSSVKAGQVIGYVGTPASSREPRLHFELRNGGVPVDPVGEVQSAIGARRRHRPVRAAYHHHRERQPLRCAKSIVDSGRPRPVHRKHLDDHHPSAPPRPPGRPVAARSSRHAHQLRSGESHDRGLHQ